MNRIQVRQPSEQPHRVPPATSLVGMPFSNHGCTLFSIFAAFWLLWAPALALGWAGNKMTDPNGMEVLNGKAEIVTYRGRQAVHLISAPDHHGSEDAIIAILGDSQFGDGVIEAEVAGSPRSDAPDDSRGFIGISFHLQPHGSKFETIYLRPTNARSDNQLRRNHSVQYTSDPDFPWYRFRTENPGVYESYVDLEPGAWTRMRIVVSGTEARLFINASTQPCLIVKDLKLGSAQGSVALWAHWTTDAYFSNLRINSGKHR